MIDKEILYEAIELYKKQFSKWWIDEKFKWQAVKYFKENWNVDADNFSEMIDKAFDANVYYSLFVSANHFPAKMIKGFAKDAPEAVRNMFIDLFDESKDVFKRIDSFKSKSKELLKNYGGEAKNHFQDENSITTYLWLKYPEKYYIYKFSEVKEVSSVLKSDYTFKKGDYENNIRNSINLYDEICGELKNDTELMKIVNSLIDDSCDKDIALKTLTFDFGFYISRKYEEDKVGASGPWWPSLEEYNPNLSKEDWTKYILEIEKPEHPCPMQMLRAMMELGGIASCKQLSQKFGGTVSYYVGCTMNLGRRVKKFFNLPPCMVGEQERYFPFPFLGKALDNEEGHQYLYKIRPELLDALNEIDLSDISPYYDKGVENMKTDINKNTILYGPPGTGKTYITAHYAVAIIENKNLEDLEGIPYDEIIKKYNEYKAQGRVEFTTFHQSYGYEEFIEGIKPVLETSEEDNNDIKYEVADGVFKKFCVVAAERDCVIFKKPHKASPILKGFQPETITRVEKLNYVFIIDEINRGNISKIFGELITLIEPTKRLGQEEAVKVKLPYSQKLFGVPDNVYLIGTMNTADRSIAAIDTALRRRFAFEEMMPDSTVLEGLHVDGVSIPNLLDLINERIEVLYDREHTIGHAYFTPLLKNNNREVLFDIFRNKILPLLQEYFYEDYEKIRLVLGDNQKSDKALQFINEETVDYGKLFGSNIYDYDDKKVYTINEDAFENIEAYKEILKGRQ